LKSNIDMYISYNNIDTTISNNYNNRAYPAGSSISLGMHAYFRIKQSTQKIFWGLVTNYQYKSDREGFFDEGLKPGVIYSYSPFRFQFDVGYCIPL